MCSPEPFDDVRATLDERAASGLAAGLTFTYNDPDRSTDVAASFPWVRSLVVGAHSYVPAAGDPGPGGEGSGRVARFATRDHYAPLRAALEAVAVELRDEGFRAEVLADDNRLVDRAAAVRAGVGWWGKNTMVLTPGPGPWTLLGSVVTDAELEPSEPMRRDCGTCEACLPACPTGALIAPGVLDARLCLAHILQARDWIPVELREAVGDRVYGCDDCLEACPPGSRILETAVDGGQGRVDLVELLALDDDELLDRFAHFYVPRRRASYLKRNLLVALGNSGGGEDAIAAAATYLAGDDPMLRAHAAWAMGRLGSEAIPALERALEGEADPAVRAEIEAAISDRSGSRDGGTG